MCNEIGIHENDLHQHAPAVLEELLKDHTLCGRRAGYISFAIDVSTNYFSQILSLVPIYGFTTERPLLGGSHIFVLKEVRNCCF